MKYLIAYLAIGLIVGLWCALDLELSDVGGTHSDDLVLARVLAVPFHVVLWPVELVSFIVKAVQAGVRG